MFSTMKHSIDSLAKYDRPIELMGRSFSIPNLLSILRLISMPLLLFAAWTGRPLFFQITLAVLLLMALADGVLARRLGQVTDFGAELDSWGVLEGSREAGGLPAVFLLKSLILVMASMLILQALVQIVRCAQTIRSAG